MKTYLQIAVCDDEGEEGDGCVEADVGGDATDLAVKHHEAPRRSPQVLQDLKGQSEQQQQVGRQQVDQINAGALSLHEHKHILCFRPSHFNAASPPLISCFSFSSTSQLILL